MRENSPSGLTWIRECIRSANEWSCWASIDRSYRVTISRLKALWFIQLVRLISECWFSIYGNHSHALFSERYRKKNGALNLTLCMLGSFSWSFFVVCWFFSKSTFLKNSFRYTIWVQIYHLSGKQIGTRSGLTFYPGARASSSHQWAPSRSHTCSPGAPFWRVNCRKPPLTAVFLHQFLPSQLRPPWPLPAINLHITCCSDCTTRTLHMSKPGKPSLSLKTSSSSLPLLWPHPLVWYCRSVWSWPKCCKFVYSWSMAKLHWHGAWGSQERAVLWPRVL